VSLRGHPYLQARPSPPSREAASFFRLCCRGERRWRLFRSAPLPARFIGHFLSAMAALCAGEPIEERNELPAEHLDGSRVSFVLNECFEKDGAMSDEQMAQFNAMAQRYATPQDDTTVH
jgi:hypothetical protein